MSNLTFGLAREFDEALYMEPDYSRIPALKDKQIAQADTAAKFMDLGFTRNEVNTKLDLGFDADTSGDTRYIKSSLIPETFAGAMHLDMTEGGEVLNPETTNVGTDLSADLADILERTKQQSKRLGEKSFRPAAKQSSINYGHSTHVSLADNGVAVFADLIKEEERY